MNFSRAKSPVYEKLYCLSKAKKKRTQEECDREREIKELKKTCTFQPNTTKKPKKVTKKVKKSKDEVPELQSPIMINGPTSTIDHSNSNY